MKTIEAVTALSFGVGAIFFVIMYISLMPFAIIWALNILFGLSIQFTFWTWLSAFILFSALKLRIKN